MLCVRSQRRGESRMKRTSSAKGRPHTSTILDNRVNKKELNTHLPFRSWCRHCIQGRGREEVCRKSIEEERQVPEINSEGKDKQWHFGWQENERQELCSAQWFRGREWICRRLLAWLRETGLEFVDILVKSDNAPASTILVQKWSTLRVMKSGSRMIIKEQSSGQS